MMENRTKYDAVIIGFGKGGKTMVAKKWPLLKSLTGCTAAPVLMWDVFLPNRWCIGQGWQLPREVPLRKRLPPIKPPWNRRKT